MPRQTITIKPTRKYSRILPFATAASVLFATLIIVLQLATPSFHTGKGEQNRIVLQDGSIAHLNTASHIRVDYSPHERRIVIEEGEVWFDVAKNPDRPFIVDGQYADARAVGTAFSVRETPGFTRVSVTEGTVVLQTQDGSTSPNLHRGDEGTVSNDLMDYKQVDLDVSLSWQRGQLIYDNVRLADLLTDLSRYLPKNMAINDLQLESLRVSAVLNLDDQEAMLEALGKTLPIRWKNVSDTLIIITADS
jgi:transmembrane sensor